MPSDSPTNPVPSPTETETPDGDSWMECIISHDELRPEAFVQRTFAEQRAILREMFGDDWTDEDEAELEVVGEN
jgi:hypothetical protein